MRAQISIVIAVAMVLAATVMLAGCGAPGNRSGAGAVAGTADSAGTESAGGQAARAQSSESLSGGPPPAGTLAVLVDGPNRMRGLPFITSNLSAYWEGVYRLETSSAVVLYTTDSIAADPSWAVVQCGGRELRKLPKATAALALISFANSFPGLADSAAPGSGATGAPAADSGTGTSSSVAASADSLYFYRGDGWEIFVMMPDGDAASAQTSVCSFAASFVGRFVYFLGALASGGSHGATDPVPFPAILGK